MKIKHGSYAGDGTSSQVITTDIDADFVFVKGEEALVGWVKLSTMPATESFPWVTLGAQSTVAITAIGATSFTVGTDLNNSVTYHWVAIEAEAGDSAVGTYTGNGSDNRNFAGVGFQPDMMMIIGPASDAIWWKTADMSALYSQNLPSGRAPATDRIQALQADGFQVGTDNDVNQNTFPYYWFAVKNVAVRSKVVTWNGNATDDRSITGVGFQPSFFTVSTGTDGNTEGAARFLNEIGDASFRHGANDEAPNHIQAFEPDGVQVGDSAQVNNTGAYYAWALAGSQPSQFSQVNIIG